MLKGATFKNIIHYLSRYRVEFPITLELAVRRYHLKPDAIAKLKRRGLVVPGELPAGVRLPPATPDARVNSLVRDLTIIGVRWPATRQELDSMAGLGPTTLRILIQHGLIRDSDLDALPPSTLRVFEDLGIETKEDLRERLAEGLDLRSLRNIGKGGAERLMAWAYGNEAPPVKRGLNLRVLAETKEGLQTLRHHHGIESDDEMVETLVAEALRAAGLTHRGRR